MLLTAIDCERCLPCLSCLALATRLLFTECPKFLIGFAEGADIVTITEAERPLALWIAWIFSSSFVGALKTRWCDGAISHGSSSFEELIFLLGAFFCNGWSCTLSQTLPDLNRLSNSWMLAFNFYWSVGTDTWPSTMLSSGFTMLIGYLYFFKPLLYPFSFEKRDRTFSAYSVGTHILLLLPRLGVLTRISLLFYG